ncbi:hypothetical protein BGW41_002274 [Actinomortierella wolfii]|nr:hypothetical protein BGW41_002274 [Actinomortierella wolfii]
MSNPSAGSPGAPQQPQQQQPQLGFGSPGPMSPAMLANRVNDVCATSGAVMPYFVVQSHFSGYFLTHILHNFYHCAMRTIRLVAQAGGIPMQARNLYGTPVMQNAGVMPNMAGLNPGMLGQQAAVGQQGMMFGMMPGQPVVRPGMPIQMMTNPAAFGALTPQQQQQFFQQQLLQQQSQQQKPGQFANPQLMNIYQQQFQLQQAQQQQQQQQQQQAPIQQQLPQQLQTQQPQPQPQQQQQPPNLQNQGNKNTAATTSTTTTATTTSSAPAGESNDDLFGLDDVFDFGDVGPSSTTTTTASTPAPVSSVSTAATTTTSATVGSAITTSTTLADGNTTVTSNPTSIATPNITAAPTTTGVNGSMPNTPIAATPLPGQLAQNGAAAGIKPGSLPGQQQQQLPQFQQQLGLQLQQQQQQQVLNRVGATPGGILSPQGQTQFNPQLLQLQQQPQQLGQGIAQQLNPQAMGAQPGMMTPNEMVFRQQLMMMQQNNRQRYQAALEDINRQQQQAVLAAGGDAARIATVNERFENMKRQAHVQYNHQQQQLQAKHLQLTQSSAAGQSPMMNPLQQQQLLQRQQGIPMTQQPQTAQIGLQQPGHQPLGVLQQAGQTPQLPNGVPPGSMTPTTANARIKKQPSQPTSAQSSPSPANAGLPVIHNILPNLNVDYSTMTCEEFEEHLREFMKARNTPIPTKIPSMGSKKINLLLLFRISMAMGGMEAVSKQKGWKQIATKLEIPDTLATAAQTLRKHYSLLLHPYEEALHMAKSMGVPLHPSLSVMPTLPPPGMESADGQMKAAFTPEGTPMSPFTNSVPRSLSQPPQPLPQGQFPMGQLAQQMLQQPQAQQQQQQPGFQHPTQMQQFQAFQQQQQQQQQQLQQGVPVMRNGTPGGAIATAGGAVPNAASRFAPYPTSHLLKQARAQAAANQASQAAAAPGIQPTATSQDGQPGTNAMTGVEGATASSGTDHSALHAEIAAVVSSGVATTTTTAPDSGALPASVQAAAAGSTSTAPPSSAPAASVASAAEPSSAVPAPSGTNGTESDTDPKVIPPTSEGAAVAQQSSTTEEASPSTPPPLVVTYHPLARAVDTYGGIDIKVFEKLSIPLVIPGKEHLGAVDVHALIMSLKSGMKMEVTNAINTLSTVTKLEQENLNLNRCPELLEVLLDRTEEAFAGWKQSDGLSDADDVTVSAAEMRPTTGRKGASAWAHLSSLSSSATSNTGSATKGSKRFNTYEELFEASVDEACHLMNLARPEDKRRKTSTSDMSDKLNETNVDHRGNSVGPFSDAETTMTTSSSFVAPAPVTMAATTQEDAWTMYRDRFLALSNILRNLSFLQANYEFLARHARFLQVMKRTLTEAVLSARPPAVSSKATTTSAAKDSTTLANGVSSGDEEGCQRHEESSTQANGATPSHPEGAGAKVGANDGAEGSAGETGATASESDSEEDDEGVQTPKYDVQDLLPASGALALLEHRKNVLTILANLSGYLILPDSDTAIWVMTMLLDFLHVEDTYYASLSLEVVAKLGISHDNRQLLANVDREMRMATSREKPGKRMPRTSHHHHHQQHLSQNGMLHSEEPPVEKWEDGGLVLPLFESLASMLTQDLSMVTEYTQQNLLLPNSALAHLETLALAIYNLSVLSEPAFKRFMLVYPGFIGAMIRMGVLLSDTRTPTYTSVGKRTLEAVRVLSKENESLLVQYTEMIAQAVMHPFVDHKALSDLMCVL